jgi:hypothetical protein
MKKILFIISFLASYHFNYAQSNINTDTKSDEALRFQDHQSLITRTLVINTSSYPSKTFRDFQKELKGWGEKVISYNNDTTLKIFSLTHNALLHPKEFEAFIIKYNIKASSIISYQ